jgi:hypothetical protein
MREILSLKLPWVRSPSSKNKKGRSIMTNLLLFLGGAEGDRTPDPKTARKNGQKNTILE